MEIKINLLITILLYSIIVSQSVSYIISLRDVQQNMTAAEYIVFRKLTDKNFRSKFRPVIYASLVSNLLLVVLCGIHFNGLLFTGAAVAFVGLLTDIIITIKGNLPVNNIINTWTPEKYPENWADYRRYWLQVFCKRQVANLTGFVSLLAAAIFS
ncbi:MAG TPA: hypothetical protein VK645_00845 [Chitinophagaceae bacterium]|nr:hypothetical protein [Chitinophagaceae bacterium]